MNKQRRAEIEKARAKIAEASEILQSVMDEEQEAFDNLAESLQSGERGQAMEAAVSELEQAVSYCEEIEGFLENAAA